MTFLVGFVVFILLYFVVGGWAAIIGAAIAAAIFWAIVDRSRWEKRQRKLDTQRQQIRDTVSDHLPALLRRKRLLDRVDDYGVRDDLKWQKEITRFSDTVVFPALGLQEPQVPRGSKSQPKRYGLYAVVAELIDQAADAAKHDFAQEFDPNMSCNDYEYFCAERLMTSGWSTVVTQATADQGADIVATQAGRTMVVQCKLYSKPTGNKAVQEVAAAMRHYSADYAMVIAANGYTKSAKQLATSNDVLLLGHNDLTPDWRFPSS